MSPALCPWGEQKTPDRPPLCRIRANAHCELVAPLTPHSMALGVMRRIRTTKAAAKTFTRHAEAVALLPSGGIRRAPSARPVTVGGEIKKQALPNSPVCGRCRAKRAAVPEVVNQFVTRQAVWVV